MKKQLLFNLLGFIVTKAYKDYMELLDKIGVQDLNNYMEERIAEVREQYEF